MVVTILATLLVLGVLIFVHEMGHFLAAKWVDIEVPRFSIGLGPKMVGFRRGETEYVISWIPLGGYVKMAGMADEEVTSKLEGGGEEASGNASRGFESKPLWARTFVISAGVLMNWLFAILAFSAIAWRGGVVEPRVEAVNDDSPAAAAGLMVGDMIESIDGVDVRDQSHVILLIQRRPGEQIDIAVDRGEDRLVLTATPEAVEEFNDLARETRTVGRIGITLGGAQNLRPLGVGEALAEGWGQTVYWTGTIFRFLKDLFTQRESVRDLGGPIMIGQISGEAARAGLGPLLTFMAIISINLAVFNLLPIPVLDGGHLMFLTIEAIRGKALSVEQRLRFTTVGMVLVVGLMVWAIGNDLLRALRP